MESIINDLRYYTGKFPEQALKEAIANQTEITPLLLASLDELLANPPLATKDENYMLHIYCFFLLAQFREKKAFSRIIELISWPADDVDKLFGYGVIEDLASFLFSTYDGNQSALEDIVENTAIYFWARDAVLKVLGKLCLIGEISRDYVVDFLRKMMVNAQAHNSREQVNVSILVQTVIAECGLIEMLPDIKVLYEERQIDLLYFGDYENFASIVKQWDGGSEVYYIEDIISEMQWWSCFQTDFFSYSDQSFIRIPVARAIPKVGRNEPCPCGSGKKYKKCCGK